MFDFDLKAYAQAHPDLVVRRESTRYPGLFVLKYHRRVFYKGLWTPELCEMRGLVVDADWNVVVYPFTKVYNRGEQGMDFDPDADVIAVEKINGFMAAATQTRKHGLIISTTGSLDSDYADMARERLEDLHFKEGFTYLFEICDKRDPHIIDEIPGPYLIGMRDLETGEMLPEWDLDFAVYHASDIGVLRPRWTSCKFRDVLDDIKTCDIEGYMIQNIETGETLKLKSPYYLVNKLLARIRETKLDQWVNSGYVREVVDEEYYPLIEHIANNRDYFVALDEQSRLEFMKEFIHER